MDTDPWCRIAIDDWDVGYPETTGSEGANWMLGPSNTHWLHKNVTVQADGRRNGEDWSEVLATYVAKLMEIPRAETQLCLRAGKDGSLSKNLVPSGYSLYPGGFLLKEVFGDKFQPHSGKWSKTRRLGHNLENIEQCLAPLEAPPGFSGPESLTGFDVFAGYLCLDALIANRDRHEENWAVLEPQLGGGPMRLAPSFDHASSLGFNLTDDVRRLRSVDPQALSKFCNGGTAHRLEHTKPPGPMTLVQAAVHGLQLASSAGRNHWTRIMNSLDLDPAHELILSVDCDAMSEPARNMASKILDKNLRRLRDAVNA